MPARDAFANLRGLIREVSRQKFQDLGHAADAAHSPTEIDRDVLAHWVSFVLITGETLRITFRVHFNSDTSARLLKQAVVKEGEKYQAGHSYDLFKEYCNLCGGEIKRVLAANDFPTVVSLPLMIRGFDQVFEPASKESLVIDDRWLVRGGDVQFFCSTRIEASNARDISHTIPAPFLEEP